MRQPRTSHLLIWGPINSLTKTHRILIVPILLWVLAGCAASQATKLFQTEQEGLAFYRRGDYKEALSRYLNALEIYERSGDRSGKARVLNNVALIFIEQGDYDTAMRTLNNAIRSLKGAEKSREYGLALMNTGIVYIALEEPGKGIEPLNKALRILKEDNDQLNLARSLNLLGQANASMGKLDDALQLLTESLEVTKGLEATAQSRERAIHVTSVGVISGTPVAGQAASIALQYAATQGGTTAVSSAAAAGAAAAGPAVVLLGQLLTAWLQSFELSSSSHQIQARFNSANVLSNIGEVYLRRGERAAAIERFGQALKIHESFLDRLGMASTLSLRGQALEDEGRLQAAKDDYILSVQLIEEVRGRLAGGVEQRTFFSKAKHEIYERLILLLLRLKDESRAFEFSERARARGFLDLVGNKWTFVRLAKEQPLLSDHQKIGRAVLDATEELLRAEDIQNPQARFAMRRDKLNELEQLAKEEKRLLDEIRVNNPEYASLVSVVPESVPDIQASLRPDAALMEYYLGREQAVGFLVTKNHVISKTLQMSSREIANTVLRFRREIVQEPLEHAGSISKLQDEAWRSDAQELFRTLLQPFEGEIREVKTIYIVPHRELHYLPFQALVDGANQLVLGQWQLRYLPSASVLRYIRARQTNPRGNSILVLANPRTSMPDLPAAEKEAEEIAKYYETSHIYRRDAATKAIFQQEAPLSLMVHLATHGELDRLAPLKSNLRFTPTKGDDGKLTVEEVFDLRLQADLVVLSACETALARGYAGRPGSLVSSQQEDQFPAGDELVGLSRAFMYAGAPTIVASLWKVSDDSTALLMGEFYKNLKTMPKAEALRQAQLTLMRAEIPLSGVRGLQVSPTEAGQTIRASHPYFWAPFILIGAGE